MNIVFWLLIAVVLVLAWFCLSFAFKAIGSVGLRLWNDAKKEISDDSEQEEKEKCKHER